MSKGEKFGYGLMIFGIALISVLVIMVSCSEARADVASSISGGTNWFIVILRACGAAVVIGVVLRMLKGHFNIMDAFGAIVGFVIATNPQEVLDWIS